LNLLIRPDGNAGWVHHEPGLFPEDWHADWLWRCVSRRDANKQDCDQRRMGDFVDLNKQRKGRFIRAGLNYVIFSGDPTETHVMESPPVVAYATPAQPEHWTSIKASQRLWRSTLGMAETYGASRSSLRTRNIGRPHPSLRWSMSDGEMKRWLQGLLHVVSLMDHETPRRHALARRTVVLK
jgi:hypothetical protein